MARLKVGVFTSYFGGPYQWGRDLCDALRTLGVDARHVHSLAGRLAGALWNDYDVVHTTVPFPIKFWRKPTVVTVKGDFTREQNILQRFYPGLLDGADAITTPSHYLQEKLHRSGVEVIPNAVFPERFQLVEHGTRSRLNLVTIMNFYFSGKGAGPVRAIDMLESIGAKNFRYIVVGDGPYVWLAKARAAASPEIYVKFSGLLDEPRMALSNSDLFLYYSSHDNFPNVIVEAMASGLPVLTNRVGAVDEIINNGVDGFVVDDDEQYSVVLGRLMTDSTLRRSVGLEARRSVERKFNWNTLADRYVDIYRRMCA